MKPGLRAGRGGQGGGRGACGDAGHGTVGPREKAGALPCGAGDGDALAVGESRAELLQAAGAVGPPTMLSSLSPRWFPAPSLTGSASCLREEPAVPGFPAALATDFPSALPPGFPSPNARDPSFGEPKDCIPPIPFPATKPPPPRSHKSASLQSCETKRNSPCLGRSAIRHAQKHAIGTSAPMTATGLGTLDSGFSLNRQGGVFQCLMGIFSNTLSTCLSSPSCFRIAPTPAAGRSRPGQVDDRRSTRFFSGVNPFPVRGAPLAGSCRKANGRVRSGRASEPGSFPAGHCPESTTPGAVEWRRWRIGNPAVQSLRTGS